MKAPWRSPAAVLVPLGLALAVPFIPAGSPAPHVPVTAGLMAMRFGVTEPAPVPVHAAPAISGIPPILPGPSPVSLPEAAALARTAQVSAAQQAARAAYLRQLAAAQARARAAAAARARIIAAAVRPVSPVPAASAPLPASSGIYSYGALEALWVSAGGPSWAEASAATIAECESGGNPRAYNPSGASGLFQILGQVVPGNIFDPYINALNAVSKFKASGDTFAQWVCQA
jgi:transglycosylase-like protein with SLT domain